MKTWQQVVKSKEDYDKLVSTGYAWEFHSDLPLSWQDCEDFLKKYNYVKETRESNYQASMTLEGIVKEEEEIGFIKSSN